MFYRYYYGCLSDLDSTPMTKQTLSRLFCVPVLMLALFFASQPLSAQRGEKTLGISGGFASYNNGGCATVYFQYSFAEHVRIAPEVGYIFRNKGKSGFEGSLDMHFPFRVAKAFKLYPLAGVTFNNWSFSDRGSVSRGGLDFGGGFDLYFTSQLKLSVQGKYSVMKDTGGAFVNIGLGYVF